MHMLQDPDVQSLMDKLHIGDERMRLFDALDADGSATLDIKELVRGLLKIRGESDTQKSDMLAAMLGVRALLDKVNNIEEQLENAQETQENVMKKLLNVSNQIAESFFQSYSSFNHLDPHTS